jgi:hypothetical protein
MIIDQLFTRPVFESQMDPITQFASNAHEQWRRNFDPTGTKPRIKKNSDGTEGDINVPFADLHPDWQKENLAAGHAAHRAVKHFGHDMEKAAEYVHSEWMKRNPKADYNAAQHVPYDDLSDDEKEKDRVHVRTMMRLMGHHPKQGVDERIGDLRKFSHKKNRFRSLDKLQNPLGEEDAIDPSRRGFLKKAAGAAAAGAAMSAAGPEIATLVKGFAEQAGGMNGIQALKAMLKIATADELYNMYDYQADSGILADAITDSDMRALQRVKGFRDYEDWSDFEEYCEDNNDVNPVEEFERLTGRSLKVSLVNDILEKVDDTWSLENFFDEYPDALKLINPFENGSISRPTMQQLAHIDTAAKGASLPTPIVAMANAVAGLVRQIFKSNGQPLAAPQQSAVQHARHTPALPAPTRPEFDITPDLKQKEKVPVQRQGDDEVQGVTEDTMFGNDQAFIDSITDPADKEKYLNQLKKTKDIWALSSMNKSLRTAAYAEIYKLKDLKKQLAKKYNIASNVDNETQGVTEGETSTPAIYVKGGGKYPGMTIAPKGWTRIRDIKDEGDSYFVMVGNDGDGLNIPKDKVSPHQIKLKNGMPITAKQAFMMFNGWTPDREQGVAEGLTEMDKSQTPPGRDTGPREGPEKIAKPISKEKMVNHALDTLAKSMDKKDNKKKNVKEGLVDSAMGVSLKLATPELLKLAQFIKAYIKAEAPDALPAMEEILSRLRFYSTQETGNYNIGGLQNLHQLATFIKGNLRPDSEVQPFLTEFIRIVKWYLDETIKLTNENNDPLMKKLRRALIREGRVKELADDLKTMSDADFMKKYGKAKAAIRRDMKRVDEAEDTTAGQQFVGTGTSSNRQMSVDIAAMNARRKAAQSIAGTANFPNGVPLPAGTKYGPQDTKSDGAGKYVSTYTITLPAPSQSAEPAPAAPANNYLDSSPATSGATGSMSTGAPAAVGPATGNYMKVNELSTNKLGQYKTAAARDAKKADQEGDFKRGDRRFHGMVQATKKQFDNDAKKVDENYQSLTEANYLGWLMKLKDMILKIFKSKVKPTVPSSADARFQQMMGKITEPIDPSRLQNLYQEYKSNPQYYLPTPTPRDSPETLRYWTASLADFVMNKFPNADHDVLGDLGGNLATLAVKESLRAVKENVSKVSESRAARRALMARIVNHR